MKTLKISTIILLAVCMANISKAASVSASERSFTASINARTNEMFTGSAQNSGGEWTLCYSSGDVFIYEKWIPVTTEHLIRERKGEMYVNCSLEQALKVITDYENVKNWTRDVKENRLVRKFSDTKWITYTLFDLPWPFQNRDIVTEYCVNTVDPGKHVQIKIRNMENIVAPKAGVTRIVKYNGYWTIKRINDQKCWVCFGASCDMPPAVARSIQDPIVRKSFCKNLINLKKECEK
jgi:hypothetical protein